MKPFFLERRWINNQRKSNSMCYNTPHWKIIALICCARRSPKVPLITVFVSIVAWKQARWPPLFITFLISPCLVTSTYQISLEIYDGIFYQGITLNSSTVLSSITHFKICLPKSDVFIVLPYLGLQSKFITRQLKSCIYKFYGCINLKLIFRNTHRINSLFTYKDRFNRSLKVPMK